MTALYTDSCRPEDGCPIIQVNNLTVGYGDVPLLEDVSFEIPQGQIVAVLGRSGCGKTTLFKSLVGLLEPSQGEVILAGHKVRAREESLDAELMSNIGVLFQSGALFSSMTVAENVAFPLRQYTSLSTAAIEALIVLKLAEVGLSGYERYMPSDLSGGMQKRAALARAMALDPPILFLDEPSAGLDPVSSAELDETIRRINTHLGSTIVLITHELATIFAVAHRALMIDKSERKIIGDGPPWELAESSDERIREFFTRGSTIAKRNP